VTIGCTVWITGLSGSGKTTVSDAIAQQLDSSGIAHYTLDGDVLREGLNRDLGFSRDDRRENVRRVGEVARLFADAGFVVLVPLISPYRDDRDEVRRRHIDTGLSFLEVYLDVPLEVCEQRDPKGLYAKVRAGEIHHFTGVDDPYEPPVTPDLALQPGADVRDDARRVVEAIVRISQGNN
jgi:bifunctional enzyme CysN/CysC